MASSTNTTNIPQYIIPSWFLRRNVILHDDIVDNDAKMIVVDKNQQQRPARFGILQDDYEAIRLTATTTLIRNQDGALPEKMPTMFFQMRREYYEDIDTTSVYYDSLVRYLAKDIGVDLITVSIEDLEDLGQEFHLQDQKGTEKTLTAALKSEINHQSEVAPQNGAEVPGGKSSCASDFWSSDFKTVDKDAIDCFVLFYFSMSKEDKETTKSYFRKKAAVDALLEAARTKRGITTEKPLPDDSLSTDDSPVILHLRDARIFADSQKTVKILHTFAYCTEMIRTTIIGLCLRPLCVVSGLGCEFHNGKEAFLTDDLQSVKIASPPNRALHETFYTQSSMTYTRKKNAQRFKQILWKKLSDSFEPQVLDLDNEDDQKLRLEDVFSGKNICDVERLMRAALQIAGKRWDTEKEKSKETEKNNDNYQENNEEPWKGLTLKQRLDKISKTCNNAEKFLLKCVIDPARLTTTYDDVIIDDEVKKQVQELIGLWQLRPQAASTTLLQHIRITGALFYGAPGTGKTLLGRAIASDGRYNMLALDSADVKSKWVGESEKYIAAAFSLAAKLYPCVLFVDEVDALFYRRGDNDSSWERAALNQFLNEMDGLTTQHGENSPFIIAGTNHPGDLDDAFLRRLPHKVLFSLPSAADRERIFQVFLSPEDIDPQVDLKALARRTEGFSGSDIRSLRGHAGVAWSMEQRKSQTSRDVRVLLRQHHFEKALKSTKATVSTRSMDCLSIFAGNFNPVE